MKQWTKDKKDKHVENVSKIEVIDFVSESGVPYAFALNKASEQLLEFISLSLIFLKTFRSEFSAI